MGTKLQYAINLLEVSRTQRVHDWDYFHNKGLKEKYLARTQLDKLQDSMDRMLEQHNIDSIKKTMQMQEDIFRHQVQELHKLYSVQKMLMDELKKEIKQKRFWSPMTTTHASDINHSQFPNRQYQATQTSNCGYNLHFQSLRDDPSARERSGSCSGDTIRIMPKGFDLERPADEDISTGISTAIDNQLAGPSKKNICIDGSDLGGGELGEVELTLSIGGGSTSQKTSSKKHLQIHGSQELGLSEISHKEIKVLDLSSSFKSDGEDCSNPTTSVSSSSATLDQERKRPHWLFQGLKLK